MIRLLLLLAAGALAGAAPLGAQPHQNAGSQAHGRGAAGHGDPGDVRTILRTIVVHQVRYHAQHGRYASSLQELGVTQPRGTTVRITASGREGFAAASASATEECVFYMGQVARPENIPSDELICRRPSR